MELVERFHSKIAAETAYQDFVQRFQRKQIPADMLEIKFDLEQTREGNPIASVLKIAGLVESTSEALRMIMQGAVRIDGERIKDKTHLLFPNIEYICQVGKHKWAKIYFTIRGS
jgi:tyrosyl-tRNA synthetase